MEGFPEVVFILVFIAFSILEGVGRKRKAEQRKGKIDTSPGAPTSGSRLPPETRSAGGTLGTPGAGGTTTSGRGTSPSGGRERGSEGLIPKDVWEEILGLARGTPPPSQPPEPRPEAGTAATGWEAGAQEEPPPPEARSLEPLYVEHHRVAERSDMGETSPGAATAEDRRADRSQRKGKGKGGRGPGRIQEASVGGRTHGEGKRRGGRMTESLFGTGSVQDLRKAVILSEVLGAPLAAREEPGGSGEGA